MSNISANEFESKEDQNAAMGPVNAVIKSEPADSSTYSSLVVQDPDADAKVTVKTEVEIKTEPDANIKAEPGDDDNVAIKREPVEYQEAEPICKSELAEEPVIDPATANQVFDLTDEEALAVAWAAYEDRKPRARGFTPAPPPTPIPRVGTVSSSKPTNKAKPTMSKELQNLGIDSKPKLIGGAGKKTEAERRQERKMARLDENLRIDAHDGLVTGKFYEQSEFDTGKQKKGKSQKASKPGPSARGRRPRNDVVS